jgi:hypothetical protein
VFEAVRRFLDAAVSTRVVSPEILNPFVLRTGDSPFLFDDDLTAYLKQMQERARKAQGVYLTMEAAPDMPPKSKSRCGCDSRGASFLARKSDRRVTGQISALP